MKEWEKHFINTAFNALRSEQEVVRQLSVARTGYDIFEWGVASAYENVLVFTIYKKLLENKFFEPWELIWEDGYPLKKRHWLVDLSLRPRQSRWRYYVEVKWYSPTGALSDYDKLKRIKDRSDVGGTYLLLFLARPSKGRQQPLETRINNGPLGLRFRNRGWLNWVDERRPIRTFKIDRFVTNDSQAEGIFEIAFMKVG